MCEGKEGDKVMSNSAQTQFPLAGVTSEKEKDEENQGFVEEDRQLACGREEEEERHGHVAVTSASFINRPQSKGEIRRQEQEHFPYGNDSPAWCLFNGFLVLGIGITWPIWVGMLYVEAVLYRWPAAIKVSREYDEHGISIQARVTWVEGEEVGTEFTTGRYEAVYQFPPEKGRWYRMKGRDNNVRLGSNLDVVVLPEDERSGTSKSTIATLSTAVNVLPFVCVEAAWPELYVFCGILMMLVPSFFLGSFLATAMEDDSIKRSTNKKWGLGMGLAVAVIIFLLQIYYILFAKRSDEEDLKRQLISSCTEIDGRTADEMIGRLPGDYREANGRLSGDGWVAVMTSSTRATMYFSKEAGTTSIQHGEKQKPVLSSSLENRDKMVSLPAARARNS